MPGPNNIDFVHSQIVKWNGNSHFYLFSDVKAPDDVSAGAREWKLTIKQNLHIKQQHGASGNAIKHQRQKPTLPTSATLWSLVSFDLSLAASQPSSVGCESQINRTLRWRVWWHRQCVYISSHYLLKSYYSFTVNRFGARTTTNP